MLRRGGGSVGRGKPGFREDDHGRGGVLGEDCVWNEQKEEGYECEDYRFAHDGLILRDAKGVETVQSPARVKECQARRIDFVEYQFDMG
jgi:hypothetical protein